MIQTIAEANALIGTTWERDGKRRTIVDIVDLRPARSGGGVYGNVYWARPGGKRRVWPTWLWNFERWMRKAKRV